MEVVGERCAQGSNLHVDQQTSRSTALIFCKTSAAAVALIEKILFPVDFSPSCAAIAPYVKRAAGLFGSRVTLVHVFDLASHNGFELYVRSAGEVADDHQSIAQDKLDSFLTSDFPLATCPRILCSGEAAARIAEIARAGGFDLIMMPTHAGRFRRMLLGSTTAKVLDDADCPVWTTEHAETETPRSLNHRVWVCAIGLSPDSERVLRLANRAAAAAGAELSLIHVTHDGAENNAHQRLDELQKKAGSQATVHIATGPVKKALLDSATRSAADALIIGRTPRTGTVGRIRDLAYSLVRDSPFPVLSI
jgi:nucleotide-binding universal stress UspA family protein